MDFDGLILKRKRLDDDELNEKSTDSHDAKGAVKNPISSSPDMPDRKREDEEKLEVASTGLDEKKGTVMSDIRSSPDMLERKREDEEKMLSDSDEDLEEEEGEEEDEDDDEDSYEDEDEDSYEDEDEDEDEDDDHDSDEDIGYIKKKYPDKLFQQSFWDAKKESPWWPPPHSGHKAVIYPDGQVKKTANLICPYMHKYCAEDKSDRVNIHTSNAIQIYNRVNGTNYNVVEVVDVKIRAAAGCLYYITCTAKNGGEGSLERFQIHAFSGINDPSVSFCRLERKDDGRIPGTTYMV